MEPNSLNYSKPTSYPLQETKQNEKQETNLENLRKKIETVCLKSKEYYPDLARKSEMALKYFMANVEKIEPKAILKEPSEFEHFKDKASGIKIERYPDGQSYALL